MVEFAGLVVMGLQGCILGLLVFAVRRGNIAAAINAFGVLVLSLLPWLVEIALTGTLDRGVSFGPVLPLWIAAAGVLHALGMLGLYETTWWWDHFTHTVSAALVAALLYAGVVASFPALVDPGRQSVPVVILTVGGTLAIGVFWELIELVARDVGERIDVEPVLVHYGWRDTVADLAFDVAGALAVVGLDLRLFVPVLDQFPNLARTVLVGSGAIVVGGSVVMALVLGVGRATSG